MNFKAIVSIVFFASAFTLHAADMCEALTITTVGDATPKPAGFNQVSAAGTCSEGVMSLEGAGHDFYWGWDRGAFAYFEVTGSEDFTFTAKINGSAEDLFCTAEKVGICAREGLVGNDRAVQLRWDGFFGGKEDNARVSWLYRHTPGSTTSEFCTDADRSSCFFEGSSDVRQFDSWLRMSREKSKYSLFVSEDGETWTQTGAEQPMALTADKAYVGLVLSCGNFGNSLASVDFSNLECTGPGCPAGAAAPTPVRSSVGSRQLRWRSRGSSVAISIPRRHAAGTLVLLGADGAIATRLYRQSVEHGSVVYHTSGPLAPGSYVIASIDTETHALETIAIVR